MKCLHSCKYQQFYLHVIDNALATLTGMKNNELFITVKVNA